MPGLRAFIVDDSVVYRSQIRNALEGIPGVEVVGYAPNGKRACEHLKNISVDLITLDLEMPEMDGEATLIALAEAGIKAKVILFSSHTKRAAEKTLSALGRGAADFVLKPDMTKTSGTPVDAIRALLAPRIQSLIAPVSAPAAAPMDRPRSSIVLPESTGAFNWKKFIPSAVVIASSTGGPAALEKLFGLIKGPVSCPLYLAQHMPPMFTASLADRLTRASGIPVKEAVDKEILKSGQAYIAPGDFHFEVQGSQGMPTASLNQNPARNFVRPAADYLIESVAKIYGAGTLNIVLTGMGADGRDGAVAVKKAGGAVITQDKESCVVWGMPGAVFEVKASDLEMPVEKIAKFLSELGVVSLSRNIDG